MSRKEITTVTLNSERDLATLNRADVVRAVFGARDSKRLGKEPFLMAYHGFNEGLNSWEFLFRGDPEKGFLRDSISVYLPERDGVVVKDGILLINEEITRLRCVYNSLSYSEIYKQFLDTLTISGLI